MPVVFMFQETLIDIFLSHDLLYECFTPSDLPDPAPVL